MDEKHAFLLAIIVILCVAGVILVLAYLQTTAENDFLKQHLKIEKVNVDGVQFAPDSWVLNNAKDFASCKQILANCTKLLTTREVKLWEDFRI